MKAVVEYDGSQYVGFQRQRLLPTVQSSIETAIFSTTREDTRVTAAGRTDAGAHAHGQVIAFNTSSRLDNAELRRAINAHLPRDIALLAVETAEPGFDPRREARLREYQYLVLNRCVRSPLWDGRAYHVSQAIDIESINRGAEFLIGQHDFTSFGRPSNDSRSPNVSRTAVRVIRMLQADRQGDLIRFRITGSGFMKHMIRSIVGTLLLVGRGALSAEDINRILEQRDPSAAGPPVPAHGLYLIKVQYED